MHFPEYRARRVRRKAGTRRLLQETRLCVSDLICPLYVVEGKGVRRELPQLPGVSCCSADQLAEATTEARALGITAVLLQPIPEERDELARGAVRKDGLVPGALRAVREAWPEAVVLSELDASVFSAGGQPGVVRGDEIDNDPTLELLGEIALAHARAGADFVVASAAMDGQVGYVRELLDEEELDQVGIVAGSAFYDSSYTVELGPSREGGMSPDHGGYRLDPGNVREALREATLDVDEGADMLMVRPALGYLDVTACLAEEFETPIVAFVDTGEYQLLTAALERGWLQRPRAILESLLSVKRSGAAGIVTLHALEAARALASAP